MNPDIIGVSIVPALVGIVQAMKRAGLPSNDAPIASLVLGVIAGVGVQFATVAPVHVTAYLIIQGVAVGVGLGLAASGAFSTVDTFIRGASSPDPVPPAPPTS